MATEEGQTIILAPFEDIGTLRARATRAPLKIGGRDMSPLQDWSSLSLVSALFPPYRPEEDDKGRAPGALFCHHSRARIA